MITTGGLACVLDCLQERFGRKIISDRDVRRHCELGVADVLVRHLGCHLVGDQAYVLSRLDQVYDGEIVPDEVGEVVEDEELRKLIRIARDFARMSGGKLGDDAL
jgi:hypothetical protein